MRNAGIAYNPSAEERAEDEAWLAEQWARKHSYDPTAPTPGGVASARNAWEREMFSHPEEADRYLEVLELMDRQARDDKDEVRPQKFGGHYVFSLDLGALEKFGGWEDDLDQSNLKPGTASTFRPQDLSQWGSKVYDAFPKGKGRLHYEDVLAAFFEAAVKRVRPRPRQNMDRFHEALREVQYDRRSVREVGKAEGVGHDAVVHRRKRAVAQLVETISPDGLEGVARELVWFMKANSVNLAYLPEWVRYRAEGKKA